MVQVSCRCKGEKQSESQVQQVAEAAENPNKVKTNRDHAVATTTTSI